jgi:small subunit ribosomal protein S9
VKTPAVLLTSGKRKSAIARCVVRKGAGRVRVNQVPLELYEPYLARQKIQEPILAVGDRSRTVDLEVRVSGGGIMGQASAARTAVARALVGWLKDSELETTFKRYDRSLLVSDPRRKLPKRPGGRGARKRRQKSYR